MLILTRRTGETLMIGEDVIVTVLSAGGGQTTIGVNAPSNVGVYKEEIYKNIKQEQMES
jgi:carbon storage regulator